MHYEYTNSYTFGVNYKQITLMLLTPKQVHKYEVKLKESVSEIKRERFEKKKSE